VCRNLGRPEGRRIIYVKPEPGQPLGGPAAGAEGGREICRQSVRTCRIENYENRGGRTLTTLFIRKEWKRHFVDGASRDSSAVFCGREGALHDVGADARAMVLMLTIEASPQKPSRFRTFPNKISCRTSRLRVGRQTPWRGRSPLSEMAACLDTRGFGGDGSTPAETYSSQPPRDPGRFFFFRGSSNINPPRPLFERLKHQCGFELAW